MTIRHPAVRTIWIGAVVALVCAAAAPPALGQDGSTIEITSPLGRTGAGGRIRIVARVESHDIESTRVQFFVDGQPAGVVEQGPPYAVEWLDENPFEPRHLVVELERDGSVVARDEVRLPAYELVDRTEVRRILLEAGVYDAAGQPVPDVPGDAFVVREDGHVQPLDLATREALPTTVVLLVDNSQSMWQRMPDVRKAAERFARTLTNHDRVIVAPFSKGLGALTGPTADVETIGEAITAMRAGGGTAIHDSIVEASRLLESVEGRRTIILITDGFDENSEASIERAIARVHEIGATIYCVGIGGVMGVPLPSQTRLRALADQTGGRVYFPWRDSELAAIGKTIAADAHSRYLLTYTPTNQKRDGTWREITVAAGEGLRVRTRPGYRAPAPPPIRPEIEFSIITASEEAADVSVDDFEVFEDDVPQVVDTFQEAVDPVSIVLALDASGSMRRAAPVVQQTASDFVKAVRPEDRLALMTFADVPLLAHKFTENRQPSIQAITAYQPTGGTALYDAIAESLTSLKSIQGRRAIVVLSDGRDEDNAGTAAGSVRTLDEVLELTRQVGAAIFTIGLGDRIDRDVLRQLSRESGGESYFSLEADALGAQFDLVIENLRRRYVVSYTSTQTENDGRWRSVRIRPRRPNIAVAAQSGYFAPEP
jgi:VWFA-related protein